MSNSAEIIQLFPPQDADQPDHPEEHQSHRVASLSDGYVRTATSLVEALAKAPISSREARVLRAVERMTYGWNKSSDWIADSVLSELTGMTRQRCSEAKNSLLRKRVLIRQGGSRSPMGINPNIDEWDFSEENQRVTPKRKSEQKQGQRPQDRVTQRPQDRVTPIDTIDINSSTNVDVPISDENGSEPVDDVDHDVNHEKLPACPHQKILDIWEQVMPDMAQPSKSLWAGTQRERELAARWKQCFTVRHDTTGELLYTDLKTGLDWWTRFFQYLRKSPFLMGQIETRGREPFRLTLDWIVKRGNFTKIMENTYHNRGGRS